MGDVRDYYPEFVPNQILTNTQLNQLREHLEAQERLSRVRLSGTGIACGLAMRKIDANGKRTLVIERGYGTSSAGYLVALGADVRYTHFRTYADPDAEKDGTPKYAPWRRGVDVAGIKNIIELIEEDRVAEARSQGTISELRPATAPDHVVVLYLEFQPVELNSCLVTTCDNKGQNVNLNVRALLVPKTDLTAVPACPAPPTLGVPPRLHTRGALATITNATQLNTAFGAIVGAETALLCTRIDSAFGRYSRLLALDDIATTDRFATQLPARLPQAGANQYTYDALRDFAAAHREAETAAFNLTASCAPELHHPRHLMLGALDGTDGYRNPFISSAVRDAWDDERGRVRGLFTRLIRMRNTLNLTATATTQLVTSNTEAHALGERALPFYFPGIGAHDWLPGPRCEVDTAWTYRHPDLAPDADRDYNLATFLRIEGHLGRQWSGARDAVKTLRQQHNIEFHLLCSFFDDNRAAEAQARQRADELLEAVPGEFAEARKALEKLLATREGSREPLEALQRTRIRQLGEIAEASAAWLNLRALRPLHCDVTDLEHDYQQARAELICIGGRLSVVLRRTLFSLVSMPKKQFIGKGLEAMLDGALPMLVDAGLQALLASPSSMVFDDPEKAPSFLHAEKMAKAKLNQEGAMRFVLLTMLGTAAGEVQRLLDETLPRTLSRFDYYLFAARYRVLARRLMEIWAFADVLGLRLMESANGASGMLGDAPPHAAEGELQQSALLGLARSCMLGRFSAIFHAYEALRARDPSLFRNLAKVDGLEHLAGVGKGGTFILVCDKPTNVGKVEADFALAGPLPCCCKADAAAPCLPPLALPEMRVVKLVPRGKDTGYEAVSLSIGVPAHYFGLNDRAENAAEFDFELLSPESMQGAKLEHVQNNATFKYRLENPTPGTIDRFAYRISEHGTCEGVAIGEIVVVLAVDPVPTGAIAGVVYMEGDAPAVGATVRVDGDTFAATTTTDSKGEFTFGSVPAGRYSISAEKDGAKSGTEVIDVEADATATIGLWLIAEAKVGTLLVRVRDQAAGPLSAAKITLHDSAGAVIATASSDAKGEAVFQNRPAGSYTAKAEAAGFVAALGGPVAVTGGAVVGIDITLVAAQSLVPNITIETAAPILDLGIAMTAARIEKYARLRLREWLVRFNGATDDPRVLKDEAYRAAAAFFTDTLADPDLGQAQLAAAYKQVAEGLAAAAKQASPADKPAYQSMLTAVSSAYLDRVAMNNPTRLAAGTGETMSVVGAALKQAGIDADAFKAQWNGADLAANVGIKTTEQIARSIG